MTRKPSSRARIAAAILERMLAGDIDRAAGYRVLRALKLIEPEGRRNG